MKTVLITGGSRGIGRECVRIFSKTGRFKVVFLYKNSENEAKELESETGARAIQCDISNEFDVSEKLNGLKIDILVNNAGIALEQKLITDVSASEWDRVFDTDLKGMFLVTKKVLPHMIHEHWGRIVNVSSVWGVYGGSCEVCYSAAKAGVVGFTKALAKELAPSNILVNCIAPGMVDTDMNKHFSNEELDLIKEEIPIGRIMKAEECAGIIFDVVTESSGYMMGQIVVVDGGFRS